MIIHEHGKLTRKFIYTDAGNDEGREEPAMVLFRPGVKGKCAIIPMSCAWKYNEPGDRQDMKVVMDSAMGIAHALDYPLSSVSAARIVTVIQDGLDELIMMPPRRVQKQHVGEATLAVNGVKHSIKVEI